MDGFSEHLGLPLFFPTMTLELLSITNGPTFSMEEKQIHLLEHITEETNPFALRNLKEQYNQTVDLQLERRRELPDPFPPEIWLQIFRDVGSGHKDDDESNPIDHLLLASLVSAKWRDAILNVPKFWTEITVDPAGTSWEDELFKLHMAMYLSGEEPLTLVLRPSCYQQWEGEKGMLRVISNHRSRFQKIFFVGAWHPDCDVNKILLSLGPLPQLRVAHVMDRLVSKRLSWDEFLSNAPALVSINILLPLEVLQGDSIKSCREISVSHLLGDISMHLLKFQRMTSLSCSGGAHKPISPPMPRKRFDNFGDLEEFNYYQNDIVPLLSTLQVASKLTTLSINIGPNWSILTALLGICQLSRVLFSLEIQLENPTNTNDQALSGPAGPLVLRSLAIKYFTSTFPDERRRELGRRQIADLVDVLDHCTPAVEEFYFHARLMDYIPFKYISSRRHLFGLTLSIPDLLSTPDDMLIQSKTLVYLNLKISATAISGFFRGLECPDLHRIVFLVYENSSPTPIATFDPAALPRLESIEWSKSLVHWRITSLQTLRKIILTGRRQEMIAELCLHFIMRPHDCPSLEYIRFGAIPQWDLIFMMLERRNHSIRHGVSRITTLVFPTGIPYSLLAPITELLNGRFALRISYQDVSISSIAEFYFDTSITGCGSCLLSMHSCTQEVKIRGWKTPKYRTSLANLSTANPPLSDKMSSWLNGREERERNWDAKNAEWYQQRTFRSDLCSDSIISKRMVVTGLTLKDIHLDAALQIERT